MHHFADDFPKTLKATAPVAGQSLSPQVLQVDHYTSRLPVAMLDYLRMYCSDYGDSSSDSRLDVMPNSSSGDYSTVNAGQDSEVVCDAKNY